MREIIYSHLWGHPDYISLSFKRSYINISEVLDKEDLEMIRCASAPYRSSKMITPDIISPAGYACDSNYAKLVIKQEKGKIVEIGCLNHKEIDRKTLLDKGKWPPWSLDKKVWEIIMKLTMYNPMKDVMPCSAMYTICNKKALVTH